MFHQSRNILRNFIHKATNLEDIITGTKLTLSKIKYVDMLKNGIMLQAFKVSYNGKSIRQFYTVAEFIERQIEMPNRQEIFAILAARKEATRPRKAFYV